MTTKQEDPFTLIMKGVGYMAAFVAVACLGGVAYTYAAAVFM